jgi:phage tail sheath protein FI
MPYYTRPDVYVEEVNTTEGPVRAAQTGRGGLQAVTEKGPVGIPVRTRNFATWSKIFGGYEIRSRGDAAYEAKGFFDEGGFELITVRQVHYADLDDRDSFTGGVAGRTHLTLGVGATAALKQSSVGPFDFLSGGDLAFTVAVDGGAGLTPTVAGAAGYLTCTSSFAVADQDGLTIEISIDGGPTQTITFSGSTTLATDVISQINAQILGAACYDEGGGVPRIRSDKQGTDSSVVISGGTSVLTWDTTNQNGTGNVADLSSVTAAEIKAICDATGSFITQAEAIVNTDGSVTIRSLTTGVTSELDFTDANATLGFTVETLNGTDAGATYQTLLVEAGYRGNRSPGVSGNNLRSQAILSPLKASLGTGNDLAADITAGDTEVQVHSLAGLNEDSVITVSDGTNTEHKLVTNKRTEIVGETISFYIEVSIPFTNSYTLAASTMRTNEFDLVIYDGTQEVERWTGLSMLDVADNYVETIINDENIGSEYVVATDKDAAPGIGADTPATEAASVAFTGGADETASMDDTDWIGTAVGGTGFYAWGTIKDFMPICTPGRNTALLIHQMAAYCKSRIYFEYLTYVTEGMSGTSAVNFRNNVIGVDSDCSAMYAGGIEVFDPIGAGSSPRRKIQGLGALMGIRARVDSLPGNAGGPWEAPAGEGDYGKVNFALDVATDYRDDEAGPMNEAGINVIRKFGSTNPVTVWGCRTLSTNPTKRFLYINVRRFFQFVEKSIADSTRWAVHRNNNYKLWSKLEDRVDDFLTSLMPQGAFPTAIKELAFYVKVGTTKGTMTQADIDNGLVKGEVGLAPNKPGEFLVWTFTQYDSGWEVAE